jgi:SAM-dependent methyltransferase
MACGDGRIAVPMAQAGFRVTGLDSSPEMLQRLRDRLENGDDTALRDRVETVEGDMRRFHLDRLFRMVYLPFNTLLILDEPDDRYRALDCVREHLAPSGVFAFDVFTPDPRRLVDEPDYRVELDHDAHDPVVGRVHALREIKAAMDYRRQVKHIDMSHTITQEGATLAHWEDSLDIAIIHPGELDLLLQRQGFRIRHRYGGPERQPYAPTATDMQPQYVVAELEA